MIVSVNLQKVRRMMLRLGAVRNFLGGIRHCRPELRAPKEVKSNSGKGGDGYCLLQECSSPWEEKSND